MPANEEIKTQLAELIDTLSLLIAQARAYQEALPPANSQARAAIATLEKLAKQAHNEAQDLAEGLGPDPRSSLPLSRRELEVLKLASEGLTNKEIAYRLALSERTIQFHVNSIFNKTGTSSRTEAASLALRSGWLTNHG